MPSPTDLGDTFGLLWDGLDRDFVCSRQGEKLLGDTAWRHAGQLVGQDIEECGSVPVAALKAAEADQSLRFQLMLALDAVLGSVWPGWGCPIPRTLLQIRRHWKQYGRISSDPEDTGGAVLLRHVHPQRPDGPAELETVFRNVVRVDRAHWADLDYHRVPTSQDFSAYKVGSMSLKIAVCPFVADLNDLDIYTGVNPERPTYRLQGRDCAALRSRIAAAVPLLDGSGADLAVLPEGILSPELLTIWIEQLKQSFHTRPRDSQLRWILVGTGPADPGSTRNTAVLLHRSGLEIGRQDKRYPFTIAQADLWGIAHLIAPGATEDIERGGRRLMLESEFGRVAITICEDLARSSTFEHGIRQASPSIVLVPVFDRPFPEYNWARTNATDLLQDVGSRVIVANSLALAGKSGRDQLSPCFALAILRASPPNSWTVVPERGAGVDPLTVRLFDIGPSA